MKKLSTLLVVAFLALSSYSFGQSGPTVTLGNIKPTISVTGKPEIITTREEILANPMLMTPPPPCEILGFTFSILPKGKDFFGPFTITGPYFTPQIIDMIKEMENPEARIFIENIRVKCGSKELIANSIAMKMVPNKQ